MQYEQSHVRPSPSYAMQFRTTSINLFRAGYSAILNLTGRQARNIFGAKICQLDPHAP